MPAVTHTLEVSPRTLILTSLAMALDIGDEIVIACCHRLLNGVGDTRDWHVVKSFAEE